jgi:hypothetical protein
VNQLTGHGRKLAHRNELMGGPSPRLAAVDIQGPHRLAGEADRDAHQSADVQLADHGVDPGPGRRGLQILDGDCPVLGIGLQVGAFTKVLLDLFQQLHGRVGGGHPPRWAVLVDQGEADPVDFKDRAGCLGEP